MNNPPSSPPRAFSLIHRWLWLCALILTLCGRASADFEEKAVSSAKDSTVRISIEKSDGTGCGGTGFVVTKEGHVVTNYHVAQGAKAITVFMSRGSTVYRREASIIATDPERDLAILKCDNLPTTKPLVLAVIEPSSGQSVMALGFPGVLDDIGSNPVEGLSPTGRENELLATPEALAYFLPMTSTGSVEKAFHVDPNLKMGSYLAIANSAKISHGNSGGPLIDIEGRVVGVNVAGTSDRESGVIFAWAIHVSELAAFAKTHHIPVIVKNNKVSAPGGIGGSSSMQMMLLVVFAAFAVVMFMLVLRKPRTVMVDAMSRLVHPKRAAAGQSVRRGASPAGNYPPQPQHAAPNGRATMRLRGRDLQGQSYDLAFADTDFRRSGGRLVIGRNHDLSQLLLAHDSVSRQHTTLTLSGGTVQVEDRNSGNGTKVNGRDLVVGAPPVPLHHGDKLTLGEVDLMFEILN